MNSTRNMVIYAMLAAITVISKEVLAFLPNIELVSFLLILYALHFDLKGSVLIAILFSFLQMLLYGVGMWTPMYFIVWTLLVVVVYGMKKMLCTETRCAVFSGIFGLSFGFLFSLPYFLISIRVGWIYYLKGIPFDLIHGLGNYILMLVLYRKVNDILAYMTMKYKL